MPGRSGLTLAVLAALALIIASPARAGWLAGDSFIEAENDQWEFGLDVGMIVPVRKKSFSHVIDNQRAYDLLAAESTGDEIAEGWVAPPRPGTSVVSGTLKPLAEIGMHLYRRVNPWLSWGLDGGYGLKREVRIDNHGVYDAAHFMTVLYTADISYLSAPAKIGAWLGRFRPYVLAGPGGYLIYERATIAFTDADDPQLTPVQIAGSSSLRFGLNGGAGLDWRVTDNGLIGLGFQYHKVFAGADHVDFVEPKLKFSVQF